MSRPDGITECLSRLRCQRWAITSLMLNSTKGWTSTDISSYCERGVRLISTCRVAMGTPTRHRHCGSPNDLKRETSFRLESLHFSIELTELAWLGRPRIPSTNTSRFHQYRRGLAMEYLRKSAHVTHDPVGKRKLVVLRQPFWAITVPNWCSFGSHRTRRFSRASIDIVIIHVRMRHSLITRQTYISAAKRGDSHRHIARATCQTRVCKSFIVVSIQFLAVALGVHAEDTEQICFWRGLAYQNSYQEVLGKCTTLATSFECSGMGTVEKDISHQQQN